MTRTFFALLLFSGSLYAADEPAGRLERELDRVSHIAGGVVGAAAIHIESGAHVSLRGNTHFPMASTVKVPLALQLLDRVDHGQERLDRIVELKDSDLHPGSGTISDLLPYPGIALSIRNLMELMLLISDNSATDILMREAGGSFAVDKHLHALQLEGIKVSRSTLDLISDSEGLEALPAGATFTLKSFEDREARTTPESRAKAAKYRDESDDRDTATPEGMATLLARLYKGELLKPESTALLLDIMKRCRTGAARLKGMLPEGTEVAHKTGSLSTVADDVGIITLPENRGHIAIAVFVKSSEKETAVRDRAIAEIARSIRDYYLFQEPNSSK